MHPSRWQAAGLNARAAARLTACGRSRLRLSRDLSWVVPGWKDCGEDWTLDSAPNSWATLDQGALWLCGLRFGAGRNRAEIAGLVLRKDVMAFRDAVGTDAHTFALRQAPLIWRNAAPPPPTEMPLVERVRRDAGLALGCWLAELPAGLAARARLKLPAECDADSAEADGWPQEKRRQWLDLFGRVLTLYQEHGG